MNIQEYKQWRPTYSAYEVNWAKEDIHMVSGETMNRFFATTGLVSEASELMSVIHKAGRKVAPIDLAKAKDEASDVLWYFCKILDDFGWTFEELAEYNKEKLDARNAKTP